MTRPDAATDHDRPLAEIRKNVNDVVRILYVHRWAFFLPFCAAATTVFVLSLSYPRTYSATASFERRNDPVMMSLRLREGTGSFELWRSTMAKDLTSVKVLAEAVERLGLARGAARDEHGALTPQGVKQRDAIAAAYAGEINVNYKGPNQHIDFVQLSYTGADPIVGRKLLDEVKKAYIRWTEERIRELLEDQHAYFSAAAGEAFQRLNESRQRETELRMAHPSINPEQPSQLNGELTQRQLEQKNLELRRREYDAELERERQFLAASDAAVAIDAPPVLPAQPGEEGRAVNLATSTRAAHWAAEIRRLRDEMLALQSARGMTEEHPEIQALMTKRAWYQQQFERQVAHDAGALAAGAACDGDAPGTLAATILPEAPAARPNAERTRTLLTIAAIEQKTMEVDLAMQANAASIDELAAAKRNIAAFQEKFSAVREEVKTAEKRYAELQEQANELEPAMRANEAGKLCKFIDQESARGGIIPVSPKTTTIFMLALMVGFGTGAIFVLLSEVFDHIFRSTGHVARSLGLPILETIDEIVTMADRRRQMVRRTVLSPLAVMVLLGMAGGSASLAYISIERPWLYDRVRALPHRAAEMFAGGAAPRAEVLLAVSPTRTSPSTP